MPSVWPARSAPGLFSMLLAAARLRILTLTLAIALCACPFTAQGQQTPAGSRASQVRMEVDQLGVGGIVRPGTSMGIRLRLTDTATKPREVVVRVQMRDSDGDLPVYCRVAALNPGVAQPVWVYAPLAFAPEAMKSVLVSVYEVADGGLEAALRGRLGPLLGQVQVGEGATAGGRSMNVAPTGTAMLARIGTRPMGLDRFTRAVGSEKFPPFAHEAVQVVEIRTPAELPDSWLGLAPFDTIVWGSGEPGDVRGTTAEALIEWVNRGGHLVVVLPPAGQNWLGRTGHDLSEIMPEVDVDRKDGVDMAAYSSLLTRSDTLRLPKDAVVHEFAAQQGLASGKVTRVLSGPNDACIVARRSVGTGAVTVVGIDLSRDMGIVDADVFWHRVLGTRGQLLTGTEMSGLRNLSSVSRSQTGPLDMFLGHEIERTSGALKGILLGMVVFTAYLLVAGPGCYFGLKKLGKSQYSWLAYVASAGLFTGIAWGGAWLLKPRETAARHLTIYQEVFGQDRVHARAWLNVMLPWYGTATVAVGGVEGKLETGRRRWAHNMIAPWDTINEANGGLRAFPDTREYAIDSAIPASLSFPSRSTVKLLQADWLGARAWRTFYPVNEAGDPGSGLSISPDGKLVGRLSHEFPGSLHNVVVVFVPGQRAITAKPGIKEGSRELNNTAMAFHFFNGTVPAENWEPGQVFDLRPPFAVTRTLTNSLDEMLRLVTKRDQYSGGPTGDAGSGGQNVDRMKALAFLPQLPGPDSDSGQSASGMIVAQRAAMHGMDVARWCTQPCVIILAELSMKPSPVPFFVEGEALRTEGSTWIQWVYPLPDMPPVWGTRAGASDSAQGADGSKTQPPDSTK